MTMISVYGVETVNSNSVAPIVAMRIVRDTVRAYWRSGVELRSTPFSSESELVVLVDGSTKWTLVGSRSVIERIQESGAELLRELI